VKQVVSRCEAATDARAAGLQFASELQTQDTKRMALEGRAGALGLVAVLLTLGSCAKRPSAGTLAGSEARLSDAESSTARQALATYASIAYAGYSDSAMTARTLLAAIDRLIAAPDAAALAQARSAWLLARKPYQRTEVFRFYDGPIDRVELRVNTWPIDESYVEAEVGNPRLGIIDDTRAYPELTSVLLSSLNAKEGETSISTGYHVVEYLLWGKDTHPDGPGDRPFTDYVAGTDGRAARRGRYLRLAAELLISDLESVRDAWAPDRPGNYRAAFLARRPIEALALALKGMGSLSGPELAGERLTVAYETKAQENEHSCFSDNTVNDLADDALGIENVCRGRYEGAGRAVVHGTGVCDAVAIRNAELGARLASEISASVEKVRSIPAPFDQAILGADTAPGRVAIQSAVSALERQTKSLAEVAALYDVRSSEASRQP
jgi:putative iron-regulated protein